MLTISKESMKKIADFAEKSFPCECCGILIGTVSETEKSVKEIISTTNSCENFQRMYHFEITPEQMFRAEKYAVKNGLAVVGFYHSHPHCAAIPSDNDLCCALPVYSYVIASVIDGKTLDIRSWTVNMDSRLFDPEKIIYN